jgi:hypothetical protein
MAIVRGNGRWNGVGADVAAAVADEAPGVSSWPSPCSSSTAEVGVVTCAASGMDRDRSPLRSSSGGIRSTPGREKLDFPGEALA